IHISELSWSHVTNPSEVVSIGDVVKVKVLDIDNERQRISLGLKQTQDDPWERFISTYGPGNVLDGKVTKLVDFGAFVEVLDGVEGLVHISELADRHVENPREVVDVGETINVKILEIDEERRRVSLSIKRIDEQNMPLKDLGAEIEAASGEEGSSEAEAPAGDASEEAEVAAEEEAAEVTEDVEQADQVVETEDEVIADEEAAVEEVDPAPEGDDAAEPEESTEASGDED
ncbi:MAG: S1 RNA-binding domain-containing protein, partial [Solirubrobacterales bacterium]